MSAIYRIGIDPGCSGAVVVLKDGEPWAWSPMPTMIVGKATRVNGASLAGLLNSLNVIGDAHAFIEAVGAMPGQGVSSMFTFGHAAGVVDGVVQALGIPCTRVTPQAWKKRAGLIGTDKDAARTRAIQLWPRWAELHKKAKGQALADAALIALHG